MRILVAGGAGFIGSHLCGALLQAGHSVLCVDNLLTGSRENIAAFAANPAFEFREHDITQPLSDTIDAVFHLASPASPVSYWTYAFETMRANTEGTWQLLDLARRHNARFLMASTSEVYGDPLVHPQTEDYWGNVNPVGERACYDESKRYGETITMEFVRRHQMDARLVRIFNTYGPHNQINDGRMIPNFIAAALANQPLIIHGTGEQTRSICFVSDLVDGLIRAMFTDGIAGEVFNLGSTDEHTVREWAQRIIALTHSSSPLVGEPKRVDDPERRRPNIDKARRVLGWQPRVGSDEGLGLTIAWFRTVMTPASAKA